jgi:hypothetical protein
MHYLSPDTTSDSGAVFVLHHAGAEFAHAFWIFVNVVIAIVAFQILLFRWKNWL